MSESHATGWASDAPTPAQLMELFAQIKSGRVTKQRLQDFLRNKIEVEELPYLTEPPTRSQLIGALEGLQEEYPDASRNVLVFRLHYGLKEGKRYTGAEIGKMHPSLANAQKLLHAFDALLHDGRTWSALEIGQVLSVTRERVEQIESKVRRRIQDRLRYKYTLTKTLVRDILKRAG